MPSRTHTCGELNLEHVGQEVALCGWVQAVRNLGSLLFLQLRDRYGCTQVTLDAESSPELFRTAETVRSEYVLRVAGQVKARTAENVNPNMPTGAVEVWATHLEVLAPSELPPFEIIDEVRASEELRMKMRYLDLRRAPMARNLVLRHQTTFTVRQFMDERSFLEIETPFLTRSTPEGARDYLVPSRIHHGKFYALPQSPQIFKQLLMVSGMDRYFQIVRCFRDEDLRADRQPEFTQIDVEMSFINREDIFELVESMLKRVFALIGVDVPVPFPRMPYAEAMDRFGSDRPDTRFGLELKDLTDHFRESAFGVFRGIVEQGGVVRGIGVPGGAKFSRKDLDGFQDLVKSLGLGGLAWVKLEGGKPKASLPAAVTDPERMNVLASADAREGDVVLIAAGPKRKVCEALGVLRLHIARREGLMDPARYNFLWVVDFPLFDYDEEEKRYVACHHPFTSPIDPDFTDPATALAQAYDVVLNGLELGGGSIRNHRTDVQQKMFDTMGMSAEESRDKFGFLLDALRYGAPPHGGIALGLDRLVMILAGKDSLREVIAFPKTTSAICLLSSSPSEVSTRQLDELKIKVKEG